MPVDQIIDYNGFQKLEASWNTVYAQDSEANVFLSHQWIKCFLASDHSLPLLCLAWRPVGEKSDDCEYKAFLPLWMSVQLNHSKSRLQTIARSVVDQCADYGGFLCADEAAADAIPEIVDFLLGMPIHEIYLNGLLSTDKRLKMIARTVSEEIFKTKQIKPRTNNGKNKLYVAPSIVLPHSKAEWFNSLSNYTSENIQRFQRKIAACDSCDIVEINNSDLGGTDCKITQMLSHQLRDGEGRGVERNENYYSALITGGLFSGHMKVWAFMDDEKIQAIIACLVDPVKKQLLYFLFDKELKYIRFPVELILQSHAIVWAIEHQFEKYDFLCGTEAVKYSLGGASQRVTHVHLKPRKENVQARLIADPLRTSALAVASQIQRSGDVSSIEKVYSQLLESFPGDQKVIGHYHSWLTQSGNSIFAERIAQYQMTFC